jgi:5'-nucleotidase
MKNLLLSNDDGIHSRGIWALKEYFDTRYRVFMVAPDRERSASGHSISLHDPIRLKVIEKGRTFSVNGTPVDAVHLALLGVIKEKIDLVITGINNGLNLGTDVFYSGTVSCAFQAAAFKIPGIAVSIDTGGSKGRTESMDFSKYNDLAESYDPEESRVSADSYGSDVKMIHYGTALHFVSKIVEKLEELPLDREILLNVNVPNLPIEEIMGVEVTRLGRRHYYDNLIEREDPKKNKYYWIEGILARDSLDEGTDVKAIHEKKVSITPLRLDITAMDYVQKLKLWNFQLL